jgi:hypothetical protein
MNNEIQLVKVNQNNQSFLLGTFPYKIIKEFIKYTER